MERLYSPRRTRFGSAARRVVMRAGRIAGTLVIVGHAGCAFDAPAESVPRSTLVVGIDVSGSFRATGHFNDAVAFAARYIHSHLNGLGDLEVPRALFVGAIGGEAPGKAQAFHPIHDFQEKSVEQIEKDLRAWFPPDDQLTDFNVFFRRAADLVQRQNLTLAPITLLLLTDGVPDVVASQGAGVRLAADDPERFAVIDLDPLEYLARNVTVRILYPDPPVAVAWERHVERGRVRIWTVDHVVMGGWRAQLEPDTLLGAQMDFFTWVHDNVDFRVRRGVL